MEDRFALLIDADNVSAKYIKPILDELSKYGTGQRRIMQAGKKNFFRIRSLRSSSSVIPMEKMQPILL